MKIKTILNQHRRDFRADYECENCGFIDNNQPGYDDINFHQNVIPIKQRRGHSIAELGIAWALHNKVKQWQGKGESGWTKSGRFPDDFRTKSGRFPDKK